MSHIVMCSSLGDVWLTPEEATAVAKAMKSNVTSIALRGSIYTVRSIQGLLQPEAYKTMYITRKRSWTCKSGNGHSYNEVCRCQAELMAQNAKQISDGKPKTPEEIAQATLRANASREWIKFCGRDYKKMANKRKRDNWIRNYIKEHQNA